MMTKEELKGWRERNGLSQSELARMYGVKTQTVQNWEYGVSDVPVVLDQLCGVWGERLRKERAEIGPVTLCYADGSMFVAPFGPRGRLPQFQQEPYPTNAAALARVKHLWGREGFHGPFVLLQSGETLWNQVELMHVVNGEDKRAPTVRNMLRKVADYVAENPTALARGVVMPPESEKKRQADAVITIGEELAGLAQESESRAIAPAEFDELLARLHELGFYPPNKHVGDVAHAIMGDEVARRI